MESELLERIRTLINEFQQDNESDLEKLLRVSERLIDACNKIRESWSGSFAGYHGRLYFRNFEPPPSHKRFSVEWGGLYGIPDGWRERDNEEVKGQIEELVGGGFLIDELEESIKKLVEKVEELRTEIVVHFSSFDFENNLRREGELFVNIENLRFGIKKEEFIKRNLPKSMITRDSEAFMQGVCLPSWLFYEGLAYEGKSICDSVREFIKLSERFVKQISLKREIEGKKTEDIKKAKDNVMEDLLTTLHSEIYAKCHELYEKGAYPEAVEKGFKVVRDRLRKLTGHETGSEAFGKGKLHIKGAAAPNVDQDFNEGVKFLTMAIDRFRNEKSHTSDAKIDDPIRAYEYLRLSSLAMRLLDNAEIVLKSSS